MLHTSCSTSKDENGCRLGHFETAACNHPGMAQSNLPLDSQHTKGRFAGKVCIITGGASGIGRATVNRFVNDGASVAAFDVNEAAGKHLQDELTAAGYNVKFYKVNVADKEQCLEGVKKVAEEHEGKIHFLVNNAGIGAPCKGKFGTGSNLID